MSFVCVALRVYGWVLILRILLSYAQMFQWNPPDALAPIVRVIYDLTEPVLGFVRRYIPLFGGLDLSPIFIFLALSIVRRALGC